MTKSKVNILIVLMAIAVLGIMVLQLVWMSNAIKVRNELFDRSVNDALHETSKKMETFSDVFFVQDILKPERRKNIPHRAPTNLHFNTKTIIRNGDTILVENNRNSPGVRNVENEVKIISTEIDDADNHEVRIEIVQMDSLMNKWEEKIDRNITVMFDNSVKKLTADSTRIILHNELAQKFDSKAKRLKNVAGKMIYETWVMDHVRIPDTIAINKILKQELLDRDIPIPFEMGVNYGDGEQLKTNKADSLQLIKTNYTANLFPGDIFNKGEVLSIYFPSRSAFILKTLIVPASLSLLFCAFIMVVFGLSIYYIIKQKKISEMKSDFINNMTHEFKTPLATISVASDTLINPKIINDKEQIRHFSSVIKKENQRMNQQVETILQIARLDKKDFEFNFKVINIHDVIEKAIQINSFQVENRGGMIDKKLNAQNPAVTTDSIHMLNLINNLLDNANKYSTNKPEILITTDNSEKGVWIKVSDKGIGMSKQVQQKIFEKFYREASGNIHNVKGFGLGLSYAKAVISANKGEIKVQSELGKGSVFEVFVPFSLAN